MALTFGDAPDQATGLDILKRLVTMPRPESLDPYIIAQLDRQDRLDEMKRNLAKSGLSRDAQGHVTSGFATGATPEDVAQLQSDINEDPSMGTAAQAEQAAKEDAYQKGVAFEQPEAQKMRLSDLADQMALKGAGETAKGRAELALESLKGQNQRALLNEEQANKLSMLQQFMGKGADSGAGMPGQEGRDFKMALDKNMNPSFTEIPMTNQERQMAESSQQMLDLMDSTDYIGQAQRLQQKGLFSPGIGIARRFLAQHGLGTMAGVDEQTAKEMGQFETTHDLVLMNLARALAGARGAGNSGLAARFDKLWSTQGDLPTFIGQLSGIRSVLEQVAGKKRVHDQLAAPSTAPGEDLGAGWGQ